MIRNVVMIRLRADADRARLDDLIDRFTRLDCPGMLSFTMGVDAGLRDGNWSVAIVADFTDAAAYRVYDIDEEHNRLRSAIGEMAEQVARVQFELPD